MAMNEENEGLLMVKATQKSHGSVDERSGILTGIDRVFAAGQAVFRHVRHFDRAQCRQAHHSQARHAGQRRSAAQGACSMTGEYLGETDSVKTEISYKAKLYALCPYKVEGSELDVPQSAVSGTPMSVKIQLEPANGGFLGLFSGTAASTHCFRMEVSDPKGNVLPWYSQNIVAEKGSASAEIPWALNETPGSYTLAVRDAVSGVKAKQHIKLEEAK